ncbi:MAG: F510_1955 family glycosylhydrolase [Pseudonocardiaceae bacterium]
MGGGFDWPVRRAFLALTTVGVALLAGCAGSQDEGVEHVHALGVDPADGALYAASHHGVFRIQPGGTAQRVGTSIQDTMGFVVIGPRHFLASGHPAPDEKGPPNLGLIESTDAGVTWRPVALSGEVDFHAIDVAQDGIIGYDSQSQQIMVSSDRKTWERRARLMLADLAVSPADPQFMLATTAEGLVHSANGGRSFAPVDGVPTLQLLDWPVENAIIGVGPTGIVGSSNDRGATWIKMGTVEGAPAALTTNGPQQVYVATDRGIYLSKDAGHTFSLLYAMTSEEH